MPRIIVPPSSGSSPPGVDVGQLGFWAPSLGLYSGQLTGNFSGANQARMVRVVCPLSQTISKIGFGVVNAATVDDPCDVGIYDAAGNLLRSSGSTLGKLNTTGAKTVPLTAPIALVAGAVYYAAMAYGTIGGTSAGITMTSPPASGATTMFGNAYGPSEQWLLSSGGFPLPNPLVGGGAVVNCPILALMQ
jgi:hypothetical protein